MIGTITNTIAIIIGSAVGSILKKGIKEEYQSALFTAMGFAAVALGVNAVVQNMPNSIYPVLFIVWNVNTKLDKNYRDCCLNSTGVK